MGLKKRKRDKSAKACRNTSWNSSETTGREKVAVAPENSIVIVEPFFGGSHKQLIELLQSEIFQPESRRVFLLTLPATKWHWRMRCSALYFADLAPTLCSNRQYIFFCSSMFDLSTFLSLRHDYANSKVRKIIYFHENQLAYPTRQDDYFKREFRDFQYGYIQILSSLVADRVCFNSNFNRQSFLDGIHAHFKNLPKNQKMANGLIENKIYAKSEVLYYPIQEGKFGAEKLSYSAPSGTEQEKPLHILWNHRWEHDKNPRGFFETICRLVDEAGVLLHISVVGESFGEIPAIFDEYKRMFELEYSERLRIENWGYVESKDSYFHILRDADIVVSTSHHEFFGVSVLEAVLYDCFPLVPNRLVYPEIYGEVPEFLYNTDNQLFKKLKNFCVRPNRFRRQKYEILHDKFKIDQYLWDTCGSGESGSTHSILRSRYQALFDVVPNTETTVCCLHRYTILGIAGIIVLTAWFSYAFFF